MIYGSGFAGPACASLRANLPRCGDAQSARQRPIQGCNHRSEPMSARAHRNVAQSRKHPEAVTLDNDYWIWAVIFTTAALTALCVVTIFNVARGVSTFIKNHS